MESAMVAELEGAGQSPPLTQLPPLLPSLSHVSLTTYPLPPTSGLKLTAPYYRPAGKFLWDQGQATHQQLCHHSMTYSSQTQNRPRPSTGTAVETHRRED